MAMVMETIVNEQFLYKSTTSTEITTRSRWVKDGMDGDDGGAAVDEDEDRCLGLPDLRRAKMDPLGKFPLQMPSGGEVCMSSP